MSTPKPYSYVLLVALLLCSVLLAMSMGRFEISFPKVLSALNVPFFNDIELNNVEKSVVINIRLPRIIVAIFIGALLSVAGAILQGVFRNPLVGPSILGVSAGSAFGGVLGILMGISTYWMIFLSFIAGLCALFVSLGIERLSKHKGTLTLVLAGIVVGAFFNALVSIMKYVADPEDELPAIVFWLLGSLVGSDYDDIVVVSVIFMATMAIAYKARYLLNVLAIGDEDAKSLGVDVSKARLLFLCVSTAMVSVSVSLVGIVGWVGLMIPHICRFLFGSDYRHLLCLSCIIGAIFMIGVDTMARNFSYGEIPLGVLTALIGAPIFAYLVCIRKD